MPGAVDPAAAYAVAIDALVAGDTRFDAAFARDVVLCLPRPTSASPDPLRAPDRHSEASPPLRP